MAFGLMNAPATFQQSVNVLLARVKCQRAFFYLDDIVVFFKKPEKHNERLK